MELRENIGIEQVTEQPTGSLRMRLDKLLGGGGLLRPPGY